MRLDTLGHIVIIFASAYICRGKVKNFQMHFLFTHIGQTFHERFIVFSAYGEIPSV